MTISSELSGLKSVEVVEVSAQQGRAATIVIGKVTTGAPGSEAKVENVGTASAAVFDFTIPTGDSVEFRVSEGNVQWKTTAAGEWQNLISVAEIEQYSNYAVCSTAAGTVAKTVSVTGFSLAAGKTVMVEFSNTNTAASPTLNVSGTGAKPITFQGSAIRAEYLRAGGIYQFVYDGTNWEAGIGAQLAEDWAVKTDGTVDGVDYSAKKYAQDAKGYRDTANTSASAAQAAQTAAETAQGKAEDAQEAAETAQTAAESAKSAAETAKGQAQSAASSVPVASTTPEAGKVPQAGSDGKIADGWVNLPQASTATPLQAADAGSAGTSAQYARGDHQHPRRPEVKVYVDGESDSTIIAATKEGDIIIREVTVSE